jgi:hypothetical protein
MRDEGKFSSTQNSKLKIILLPKTQNSKLSTITPLSLRDLRGMEINVFWVFEEKEFPNFREKQAEFYKSSGG